jgi:hypothetical protein
MSTFRVPQADLDRRTLPNICSGKRCLNDAPKGAKYCESCARRFSNKSKFPDLYGKTTAEMFKDRFETGTFADDCNFIYFIGLHDFIKVGRTERYKERLAELQIGVPYKLNTLCKFVAPDWLENKIHRYLEADHVHGEWFKLSNRSIQLLKIAMSGKYEKVARKIIKDGF